MPASTARIEFITNEYRTKNSDDSAVLTKHPLAKKVKLTSFINTEANAESLADAILALRKEDRFSWSATLHERFRFALIIGRTYTITHPRFGFSSGKNFILRGIKWNTNTKTVDAIFFGPQ